MAMNPATYDHAKHQVRFLRDEPTRMFVDLPELVKVKIEELKNEKEKVQA